MATSKTKTIQLLFFNEATECKAKPSQMLSALAAIERLYIATITTGYCVANSAVGMMVKFIAAYWAFVGHHRSVKRTTAANKQFCAMLADRCCFSFLFSFVLHILISILG